MAPLGASAVVLHLLLGPKILSLSSCLRSGRFMDSAFAISKGVFRLLHPYFSTLAFNFLNGAVAGGYLPVSTKTDLLDYEK